MDLHPPRANPWRDRTGRRCGSGGHGEGEGGGGARREGRGGEGRRG
jgi:hypothetical protein